MSSKDNRDLLESLISEGKKKIRVNFADEKSETMNDFDTLREHDKYIQLQDAGNNRSYELSTAYKQDIPFNYMDSDGSVRQRAIGADLHKTNESDLYNMFMKAQSHRNNIMSNQSGGGKIGSITDDELDEIFSKHERKRTHSHERQLDEYDNEDQYGGAKELNPTIVLIQKTIIPALKAVDKNGIIKGREYPRVAKLIITDSKKIEKEDKLTPSVAKRATELAELEAPKYFKMYKDMIADGTLDPIKTRTTKKKSPKKTIV